MSEWNCFVFSHRTKTAQYDHPVKHLLVEDNLPYPSKNSLVPANPYMYAGECDKWVIGISGTQKYYMNMLCSVYILYEEFYRYDKLI
jgi:hypothetical protein